MAFPHQQSGKDHERKEDEPGRRCVLWKLFKRTVEISVYRNGDDDVNPAKNRTRRDICSHGQVSFSTAALFEPGDNVFQVAHELLPAVLSTLVVGLLIGTEASLLHAHMGTGIGRCQRKRDDALRA